MKRTLDNPEVFQSKHVPKQDLCDELTLHFEDTTVLTKILIYWIKERKGHKSRYDWLSVQIGTAFYRKDPPWKISKIDLNSLLIVGNEDYHPITRIRRFLRYTVYTEHQRKWLQRCLFPHTEEFSWITNTAIHIANIIEQYGLSKIFGSIKCPGCGRFNNEIRCGAKSISLISHVTYYANLPLWRRILDAKIDNLSTLTTILLEIQNRAGQQESHEQNGFLCALLKREVVLPAYLKGIASKIHSILIDDSLYDDRIHFMTRMDVYRFRDALSILFEERGLNFNFWRSGNLKFVDEDSSACDDYSSSLSDDE